MREESIFEPKWVWTWQRIELAVWWKHLGLKEKIKYLFWSILGRPRWVVWHPFTGMYLGIDSGKVIFVNKSSKIDKCMQRNTKRGILKYIRTHADKWRKQLGLK